MNYRLKGKVIGVFLIAAFILGSTAILGFAMSASQDYMSKEVVTNRNSSEDTEGAELGIPDFPVNDRGQTFGSGGYGIDSPDLILATGIDGTFGYVLSTDLHSYGPGLDEPQSPEEALIYMKQFEELVKDAQARGDVYVYYIPLYDSDGQTIIGEFGMGTVPPTQPPIDNDEEPTLDTIYDDQALVIDYAGHRVMDFTFTIDESVRLQARRPKVDGEEIIGDIIWVTSNRSVFTVEPDSLGGTEATVTSIGRGVATLTIVVGEYEATCIVRVR